MNKQERMKLGRRKSYLEKCVMVAKLLQEHENETTVRYRIFDKHIAPVIRVSYQSFNSMLNEINPAQQLEEINKKLTQ